MTGVERLSLEQINKEMNAGRSLKKFLDERPGESGAAQALERRETTYMLRLYATFEGLLRVRMALRSNRCGRFGWSG